MALAMGNAAGLKPEIRLAKAISEYETALSVEQQVQFQNTSTSHVPSAADVMVLTREIDQRTKNHRLSRQCLGPRLTSILQSIQELSSAVDVVVAASGSPIAGSVWSALKVTLLFSCSFSAYFEDLSTLLMNVGRRCPRYREFESMYPNSAELRKAICEYFIAIVDMCTKAVSFVQKPLYSQMMKSVIKPYKLEFQHFETDLARLADGIREELLLLSHKEDKSRHQDVMFEAKENSKLRSMMTKFTTRTNQELEKSQKRKVQKVKARFLDACSTYDHQAPWRRARKKGTTSWIFDKPEYAAWSAPTSTSSRTLWLVGSLGSGKTVVFANVVESLISSRSDENICFFSCQYDDARSLEARDVIGSIVRQALQPAEPETFEDLENRSWQADSLDIDFMVEFLVQRLQSPPKRQIILIDGLDECEDKEVKVVFESLKVLLDTGHANQIFFSARHNTYDQASIFFSRDFVLSMDEANSDDISQFIEEEIERRLETEELNLGDPEIVLEIHEALIKDSKGMFLWAALQLDSICAQTTDAGIRQTLTNLPKDLPATYNRVLRTLLEKDPPQLCHDIFELVAAACRPLNLEELREALNIVPGVPQWDTNRLVNNMRQSLRKCGSLILIDEEESTVSFVHHSVKMYLMSLQSDTKLAAYHIDEETAKIKMADICVTYLNLPVFEGQLVKIKHESKVEGSIPIAIIQQTIPSTKVKHLAIGLLHKRSKSQDRSPPQLQQARKIQEPELTKQMVFLPYAQDNWLLHTKDTHPEDTISHQLWTRIITGHAPVVQFPWSRFAIVDSEDGAMKWATDNAHVPLLFSLLDMYKYDLEDPTLMEWLTKLLCDSERGEDLVLQVCKRAVNSTELFQHYILADIIEHDRKNFLPYLCENTGFKFSLQESIGWDSRLVALLEVAATCGQSKILDQLIRFDVYSPEPDELTRWLNDATLAGQIEVMKTLIDHGADPNGKFRGTTALYLATKAGNLTAMELLLDSGADVNLRDGGSGTLLLLSCTSSMYGMSLLLARGADPDIADEHGQTPLHFAAEQAYIDQVRLLLPKTNSLNAQDHNGKTALFCASEGGYYEVVEEILRYHPDLELSAKDGKTALVNAAENGHQDTIDSLFLAGANTQAQCHRGRTALSYAAANGRYETVRRILQWPKNGLTIEDKDGRSPMWYAVRFARLEAVKMLQAAHDRADREISRRGSGTATADISVR